MNTSETSGFTWLQLPAKMDSLSSFRAFVLQRLGTGPVSPRALHTVELVLEELLVNIIHYAYVEGEAGVIELGCGPNAEGALCVRIRDHGQPFNPTASPPPDLSPDIPGRKIGGLGVYFVLNMVEGLAYERAGDWNVLSFCFRLGD